VRIDETLGGQSLLAITVFSHTSRTFTSHHPPSCLGRNSPRLFTSTFSAHRVLSSTTTLAMKPMRMRQRLHPDEEPPRESTNRQPSTSPPLSKILNTQPSETSPKCNSINQPTYPPPRQGLAKIAALPAQPKLVEGLHINHHLRHLRQYTWLKET
jgi:hypothetical protein